MFKNPWVWLALLGVGGVALIWSLHARFPDALSSRDGQIDLAHSLLILGFVGASFILHRRFEAHNVIRHGLIWLSIGGLVFVGYSFRNEAAWLGNRLLGNLVPSMGQQQGDAMRFAASADGHFVVEALIAAGSGETPIRMLVDTGATDVVLSPRDAQRLGLQVEALDFTKIYQTANGTVYGAPVRLDSLTIGSTRIDNVRASVNGADMGRSLLGMSFLDRLSGYEVTSGSLILYP